MTNPCDVRRYTAIEAAVNMLRTRHHEREETLSPPPRRSRKRKAWRAEQARG